jgi:hypothetical protein
LLKNQYFQLVPYFYAALHVGMLPRVETAQMRSDLTISRMFCPFETHLPSSTRLSVNTSSLPLLLLVLPSDQEKYNYVISIFVHVSYGTDPGN